MRVVPRVALGIVVSSPLSLFAFDGASTVDAVLAFDQKFLGLISSASDVDCVGIDEVAGSKLRVEVERDGNSTLAPSLALLDDTFAEVPLGSALSIGPNSAVIDDFVVPESGRYYLRIGSQGGEVGKYRVSIHGKPPKKVADPGAAIAIAGEIDSLSFAARAGAKLSGTITRANLDLQPLAVELVSPSGALVPLGGKSGAKQSGKTLSIGGLTLPELGEYGLRITGKGGTTGAYDVDLTIKTKKPVKGTLYEDEHPAADDDDESITLEEIDIARGIPVIIDGEIGGVKPVSPYTTVDVDPYTGLPIEATLESIFSGGGPNGSIPFNLDGFYAPPIVPRNAVLVLRFTDAVDEKSLALDAAHRLTAESPIDVIVAGVMPPMRAYVKGSTVILDPVVDELPGFDASPLLVNGTGDPVASNTGFGSIAIQSGPSGLKAANGGEYAPREDLLGSPDSGGVAIGFNPGNPALDFFSQSPIGGSAASYAGFLPDQRAPRIVREVKIEGTYSPNFVNPSLGDIQGTDTFSIVLDYALDVAQNGGKGEYAGGALRLRPATPDRETIRIKKHTVVPLSSGKFRNEFTLQSKIVHPLAAPEGPSNPSDLGDPYEILRLEYYEPDFDHPIDPATFDPSDPDTAANLVFANFVQVLDRNGELQSTANLIDPLSTLTVRFSEPMLAESFLPYESMRVAPHPDPSFPGLDRIGRNVSSDGGRVWTFEPTREIQFGPGRGSVEEVGFGPDTQALSLRIVSVPPANILTSLLGPAGFVEFEHLGIRGVADLGGNPLGIAFGSLTSAKPFAEYRLFFMTASDPALPRVGVVVHRFQGQALTGAGGGGVTGAAFADVPASICGPQGNLYGDHIAEINLFSNGFLSGAPVAYYQKVHDDFQPPPSGQMTPFPFGASGPFGGFSVLGGARFQHVYRAVDCSPDYQSLGGTKLDLFRVSMAPTAGVVSNTILPDVSIHAGHSAIVPDTAQQSGIPSFPTSGLGQIAGSPFKFGGQFTTLGDPNTAYVKGSYNATVLGTGEALKRQLVLGSLKPGQVADFYDGVPVLLDAQNLYSPAASPDRAYLPLPAAGFSTPFPYDNGGFDTQNYTSGVTFGTPFQPKHHSLVLEYRVRVINPTLPPSTQNSFTFAVGVLTSALPRFRIFTMGVGCSACCQVSNCSNTCAVSLGPVMNGSATGGGPLLDPDLVVNAIGPDVAAPGLECTCLASSQNHIACSPGFFDASIFSPNAEQVALGQANTPIQVNMGDSSRYFMVFDYVKRSSTIVSPYVRAQSPAVTNPEWLEPILSPPLGAIPLGTSLTLKFRASTNGLDAPQFVAPEAIATLNGQGRVYIQFQAEFVGDSSTLLVPALDSVVIPFRH